MKLKLLTLFSMMWLVGHAQEEIPFEKKVKLGLKIGVNASVFTREVAPFDGDREPKFLDYLSYYRPSGLGGVTALVKINKRFSLGAEALFNSRGMAFREPNTRVVIVDDEGNESFAYAYYNYNIDYIEFPVMINYGFKPPAYKVMLIGYGGIAPGTVINRKYKIRHDKNDNGSSRKRDEKGTLNYVNPFNASVLAGIQVGEVSDTRATLFADLRFSYTLLPVFERSMTPEGGNLKTDMFTTSIAIGVRF